MKLNKLINKLQKLRMPEDVEVYCYNKDKDVYFDPVCLDVDDIETINIVIEEI